MRKSSLILLAIILVLAGIFFWWMSRNQDEVRSPDYNGLNQNGDNNDNGTTTPDTAMVRVTAPQANTVVTSPLTFRGEARGNWFFEASFPVTLQDANGRQMGQGIAQAQGEWMTTDFVPFSGTLTFTRPTTTTGILIFHKDNPSGLPQNDAEVRVPVRFSSSSNNDERTVSLYYYNESRDKNSSGTVLCSAQGLVAVERQIPLTNTPIQDTIKLLLRGELTSADRASGLSAGGLPLTGVGLTSASLSNGVLTLTFSDPQSNTSGGSCKVSVLKAMIERTAKQFNGVTSVQFLPANAFQP